MLSPGLPMAGRYLPEIGYDLPLHLQLSILLALTGAQGGELFQLSPTQPAVVSTHQQPTGTTQMAFCWSGEKVFLPTRDGRIRILSYPDLEPILHLNHATENEESAEFMLKAHTA